MSAQQKPVTAFALSLTGGVLMFLSGGISSTWFMSEGIGVGGMMGGLGDMMGGFQNMMNSFQVMMGGFGVPFGFMGGLSLMGLVSGIFVIISALMLNARPSEHTAWGTMILVFSIISLLGMGGFYLGALLGIAGGAIALSWKPTVGALKQEAEGR
jgi:hypothetical protein